MLLFLPARLHHRRRKKPKDMTPKYELWQPFLQKKEKEKEKNKAHLRET